MRWFIWLGYPLMYLVALFAAALDPESRGITEALACVTLGSFHFAPGAGLGIPPFLLACLGLAFPRNVLCGVLGLFGAACWFWLGVGLCHAKLV